MAARSDGETGGAVARVPQSESRPDIHGARRIDAGQLRMFCAGVLTRLGVSPADAKTVADALVSADLHGIDSHGTAHLRRYVNGLVDGSINARPNICVANETPSTALLDGDRGLGFVVAHRAMSLAIEKAGAAGSGWVVARRSTHYGAAGYWAGMALEHGMIGFSMTNATPRVAPTFGARGMLGTNPIAIAVPAGSEPPFVLDMATSVVPIGRLEVYGRLGKQMPAGWILDADGQTHTDPVESRNLVTNRHTFALPLGGAGELGSGYKGYGLAFAVEILSSLLAGYSGEVVLPPAGEADLGQFFGALSINAFRPLADFSAAMDARVQELKSTPVLPGAERVLVAGQKAWESYQDRMQHGIPLHDHVREDLREIGKRYGVEFD